MALRSDRHRNRPIATLAFDAGTTIGPRCATIHDGPEYTTSTHRPDIRPPPTQGPRRQLLACKLGGVHIQAAMDDSGRLG